MPSPLLFRPSLMGFNSTGLHAAGHHRMSETIPVIDIAGYLAGRAGALEATASRVREALTTVGFLVVTGHDVPRALICRTFAEARRFHDLPMAKKLALKLNEHINRYMAMSR